MFSETDGSRKAIGDVDVLHHDGVYHLFHLVLPNHDFIAHAVSTDGINWRRVRNAIFIGDPGSWDDLMLWTMHVTPDPHREGGWRMFYTGLCRRDRGRVQRLGLAVSDDLLHWEKVPVHWRDGRGPHDPPEVKALRDKSAPKAADGRTSIFDESSCYPLEADPAFYESRVEEGRHLVSFRDPYYFRCARGGWLLAAARVKEGPLVRRGCVALFEETGEGCFTARAPLCHPQLYDDVEVPNVLEISGQHYLIGSIREDAKIRYWHGEGVGTEWRSYHDNVLMPQGNYAGRVCRDDEGWLLWCFFAMNRADRTANNMMPPPKRLRRDEEGLLYLQTYERFEEYLGEPLGTGGVKPLKGGDEGDLCERLDSGWKLKSCHGFEGFVLEEEFDSFRMCGRLRLQGKGKCGLLFRIDPESHDGYYLSLDLLKGVAQLRAWGTATEAEGEHMMSFETLQSGFWFARDPGDTGFSLMVFGSYIEFSVDGRILLSLVDQRFSKGRLGAYLDTAELIVSELEIRRMRGPSQMDDQLVGG